jgi:hypothetical protein
VARELLAGPPRRPQQVRDQYAQALAFFGVEDPQADDFLARASAVPNRDAEIWPDQQIPVLLFCSLLTQWRMGASGPVGLDYSVLPTVESRLGITPEQADQAFADLQVLEDEALVWLAEQQG